MSIQGVGVDTADLRRFERLIADGPGFADKWFTDSEIAECRGHPRPAQAFATRFAIKEAVWKALGPGEWRSGLPWRGIVVRDGDVPGTLEVALDGDAGMLAQRAGVTSLRVSASVCAPVATAVAIAERGEPSSRRASETTDSSPTWERADEG